MTGVQTLVPIMLDHVNAGRLTSAALRRSDERTARSGSSASASKGRIAVGYDADLTDRRPEAAARRSPTSWIASRCGWTPYDGVKVTGWPVGTFVRGAR